MVAVWMFAVLLLGADARLRSSVFRQRLFRKAGAFDNLAECEVAYDTLAEQCNLQGSMQHEDLVDDASGSVGHIAGQGSYAPPEGGSGRPDGNKGWDYHMHGENWEHLGECGAPGQSPIDLAQHIDISGQTKYVLWFDYYLDPDLKQDHRAKLVNDGHGLFYDVASNGVDLGFVKIGSMEYAATDYTFHSPSEHTMDGAVFPLELQIINKQRDGGAGIVGISILFREGKSNKFLAGLKSAMNSEAPTWSMKAGAGVGTVSGLFEDAFDLEALIPKAGPESSHAFYNYKGSLTQPPCTLGVDWWVLSNPITATREEIRLIRHAILKSESSHHGNARNTMPREKRPVWVGLTGFQHAIKYHKLPNWHDKDALQRPRGYDSGDMPWGSHWETQLAPAPGPMASPAAAPGPGAAISSGTESKSSSQTSQSSKTVTKIVNGKKTTVTETTITRADGTTETTETKA